MYHIQPQQILKGSTRIPGDKSITHRAIILSALVKGTTQLRGWLRGLDCLATLRAMEQMGAEVKQQDEQLCIQGVGLRGLRAPTMPIDCGNSGTTLRLLTGLLAAQSFDSVLTGDASLLKRPMARLAHPLEQMGACVQLEPDGCAPVRVRGGRSLKAMQIELPVASAQVQTALLLAGLYAEGVTEVKTPLPCRDHTQRLLRYFLPRFAGSESLTLNIPGDFSSAAFFIVAATITPGSEIVLKNVGLNPTRTGLLQILVRMGADIQILNYQSTQGEPSGDLRIRYAPLQGIDVPPEWVPITIDELPILCVAAAVAKGTTRIRGAAELRVKESDRIQVMAEGLQQLGRSVEIYSDGLCIEGGRISGGSLDSCGDHRIAMSFSVLGLCAESDVKVYNGASIATSFPDFKETAETLGWKIL